MQFPWKTKMWRCDSLTPVTGKECLHLINLPPIRIWFSPMCLCLLEVFSLMCACSNMTYHYPLMGLAFFSWLVIILFIHFFHFRVDSKTFGLCPKLLALGYVKLVWLVLRYAKLVLAEQHYTECTQYTVHCTLQLPLPASQCTEGIEQASTNQQNT